MSILKRFSYIFAEHGKYVYRRDLIKICTTETDVTSWEIYGRLLDEVINENEVLVTMNLIVFNTG